MSDPDPKPAPIVNAPPAVLALFAGLVGLHVLRLLFDPSGQTWFQAGAFVSENWMSEPWRLVTYAGLHGSWGHVMMNALAVLAFGTPICRRSGAAVFLALFTLTSAGAAMAMVVLHAHDSAGLIGASGGAAGLMGAASRLLGAGQGALPLSDRRVWGLALGWVITNLALILLGPMMFGAEIAWEAHLAGYAIGLALSVLLFKSRI